MYVCGPTVYSQSHIGHMVGPVIFDAVKRYLTYNGYDVTFVVNITDVDDKIIAQAAKQGCSVEELAQSVTEDYIRNLDRLGVQVDHFPKATEHIPEMLEMIKVLIEGDYAYASGGDVYFDVTRFKEYGKLSNRKIDELLAGVRKDVSDLKRNPGDFALWKGAKPGEPAWQSPWGPGRPGWHIECSAMSIKYLGESFDIHGGGLDLCFPHHEGEIAQSECYTGKPFAKYWMHNGLMYGSDPSNKMSKSKGNVTTITSLLEKYPPETIRFFLLSTHYRRPIEFGDTRIQEVAKGLGRLQKFAERASNVLQQSFYEMSYPTRRAELPFDPSGSELLKQVADFRERFLAYMDDDFNTAGAIGILFEMLAPLNRFLDEKKLETEANTEAKEEFAKAVGVFRELTAILGVMFTPPQEATASVEGLTPKLLDLLLDIRQRLRKAKNFELADAVRNELAQLGVTVEDGPEGSRWKIEQSN